jgi:hypothetical protein
MFVDAYTYHIEMEELRVGLHHMKQKFGRHSKIHYQCKIICGTTNDSPTSCVGSHATCPNITALWEIVVCPNDSHSEWHAQNCMFGTCENSGQSIILSI